MRKNLFLAYLCFLFAQSLNSQTITSVSPRTGTVGTIVTINGTGFNATASKNVVYIGGVRATVTAATATRITMRVPASPSSADIQLVNLDTRLSVVSEKSFFYIFPGGNHTNLINYYRRVDSSLTGPTISSTVNYTSSGYKMSAGDFDNDGKIDFVAIGNSTDRTLYIYQNIGTPNANISGATFNRSLFSLTDDHHAIGQEPIDLNNDGLLDLVVGGANYVTILENTSSGGTISFRSHRIATENTNNSRIKFFDLNGDGRVDILTAGNQAQVNHIGINGYSNQSFATTFTKITIPNILRNVYDFDVLPTSADRPNIVVQMAAADGFTMAGINISRTSTPPGFSVFNLNYTIGNDRTKSTYTVSSTLRNNIHGGVITADLNNDGFKDLVFTRPGWTGSFNYPERLVYVSLSNSSAGTANRTTPAPIEFYNSATLLPSSLKMIDMNGDGKLDIVVTGGANTGVDAMIQDPSQFATSQYDFDYDRKFTSIHNRTPVTGAVFADFNQDGRVDIIHNSVGSNKLFYYSNRNVPIITINQASLTNFTQCGDENRPSQSIIVGGNDLDSDIVIDFSKFGGGASSQAFTFSLDNSTFQSAPIKLSPINDTVRPTSVFIRMDKNDNGSVSNSYQARSGIATQPLWLQGTRTGPMISVPLNVENDSTQSPNQYRLIYTSASPTSGMVYSIIPISSSAFVPIIDAPLPSGSSGTLTIALPPNTPTGRYGFEFRAKEVATGCITNLDRFTLTHFSPFPAAPIVTSFQPGNTQVSIAFTPGASRTTLTNYEYSIDGGVTWIARSPVNTASPIVITGLTNGTTYNIMLRAVNARGPGASASIIATPSAPPSAPTALSATPGDRQLTITFTPATNNGSNITNYQYSLDNRTFVAFNPPVTGSPVTITGLTNGVSYTVTLRAVNAQGPGAPGLVSGTPVGVPVAPISLAAVSGNAQARISFRQNSNGGSAITNYEYSLDDGTTWIAFNPVNTSTAVTVTGLTNGTTYSIRLRALNAIGASEASESVTIIPGAPEPPTNLQGTAASRQITVSFTPGADNGTPISEYQYSLFTGGSWSTYVSLNPMATSSPLTITGLNNGMSYFVRLRAVNAIGVSDNSVSIGPLTPADVPAPPTSLQATAGNAQVTIAFVAGANGGSAITNYEYTLDGGITWVALSPARSISPISITGLTNGTTYTIQLRARNAIGTSVSSVAVTATPAAAPSAPTQLVATPGDRQITLSFLPAQNNGSPITNYQYLLNYGRTWVTINPAVTGSPIVISGLVNGTSYNVQLRAVNAIGVGAISAAVSARPGLPPQAPTNLVATPGNNQVSIVFQAGSNNGNTITNYQYSLDNGATWISLNPERGFSPVTIPNLTNNQNYNIQLRAVNAVGSSVSSLPVSVTPTAPPPPPTGLSYTAPNVFLIGSTIENLIPTVSGGTVSTYTISPALPAGLTLNASTGVISGIPTATSAQRNYIVTATNPGGSTTATLSITVVTVLPPTGLSYTATNTFLTGTPINNLTPTVSGGGAVTNYSISPALPAGLVLNATTGIISGTPTSASAQRTYTVTASNAGGSTSTTLAITVNNPPAPTGLSYTTPNTLLLGRAITNLTPTVSGGAVSSYFINPSLPAGLTLNASTGVISGTPTVISTQRTYTITASNAGGSTTATISLSVISVVAPSALTYTTPNNYTVGTSISNLTPTASGDAATGYSVDPILPAGLSLNTTTGVISGTPTAASPATNYTVTATNAAGSASAIINISVANATPPSNLSYTTPNTFRVGAAISNLTPTVGGGAVVSYSISPALPAGLSLNTTTGVISGTPTAASAATTYTITATNSGGSTTSTVDITVIIAVAPSGLSYATPQVYTVDGNAINNLTPAITGDPAMFSVSPALPAGLTLNSNTGVISGTPTLAAASTVYTVTATNAGGSITATIDVTVVNANPPTGLTYTTPNTFVLGNRIQNLTPTVSGGAVRSYSISPALPAGLTLNANTGVISGTPTAVNAATDYTVTATNSGGNATATIRIAVIMIVAPSSLSYTSPNTFTLGTAISNLSPNISGDPATFSVSPALPAGLSINSSTGVISGTPTAPTSASEYTITATNASGSVSATVRITVLPQPITGLSYSTPNTFLLRTPITSLSPTVSGGAVANYTISPALPAGLNFNTTTGVISGMPTVVSAQTDYTVTATNAAGSATTMLRITVLQQALGISYSTPNTFTVGAAIGNLAPTVIGALPQVLYKYARVVFSDVRNFSSANSIQVSEWRWLYNNNIISRTNTTVTNPGGINPSGETPPNVYDGSTSTKWLDFNIKTGNRTATLDFTFPNQGFEITDYSWSTANDATERDPRSWKVFLSNDGTNWTEVDNVTGFDATSTRQVTAGTWTITAPNPSASNFSVSPALPAGLSINVNTGVISGTPTISTTQRDYTVSAVVAGTNVSTTVRIGTVNPTPPTGLTYITPNLLSVGEPINNLIPAVSGGIPFSYSISPALPAGLSFNTLTGVISGTPTAESPLTIYTITGTNPAGSITTTVSIRVVFTAITGLSYNTPNTFTVGTAAADLTPTVTGGEPSSFSVSPALPAGLSLNPLTGVISGTPTVSRAQANYTITASNSVGNRTAIVAIRVDAATAPLNLSYPTPNTFTFDGTAITDLSPTVTGGVVNNYNVSPALPPGLNLNTSTGVISGTPSATSQATTYTITATNSGGIAQATVSITIVAPPAPSGLSYATPHTYKVGTSITNLTPTVSGGNVTSYSINPALPSGLSLNTTTGVISGTPTTVSSQTDYTVTATNSGGAATAIIRITVEGVQAPTALSYTTPSTFSVGTAITNLVPTVTGEVTNYSISPALPAGLSLNTTTGVISGTPSATSQQSTYTVTAVNNGGSTTANISITVVAANAPSGLSYVTTSTFVVGIPITNLTPTVSGGPIVGYSISPALPAGLSLNTITGVISGTPLNTTAQQTYTVTAANSGGTTTATLSITITLPAAPTALSYNTPNVFVANGSAINNLTPTVTGAVSNYSIRPALPAGLSLNTSTGVISGTPTTVSSQTDYTVTATNSGGSITAVVLITVNNVPAPTNLSYPTSNVYLTGVAMNNLTPTISGGAVTAYSITPTLPIGLTMNPTTGVISGIPLVAKTQTTYTVTATNGGGSVSATFSIEVRSTNPPTALSYPTPNIFRVNGQSIQTLRPTVSGGAVNTYNISPALPKGLQFNTSTGEISGVPELATAQADYIVTAVNSAGQVTATVRITVANDVPPSALSYPLNPPNVFTLGTTIPNIVPTITGGAATFSVSPSLPAGLSLDPVTGIISGTPLELKALTNYTITATNSGGSITFVLPITVNDVSPADLTYPTNPPNIFTVGTEIPMIIPSLTGGTGTFTVSPSLPAGLSLDPVTGVISGTPTEDITPTNFVITVSNGGGSSSFTIRIQVNKEAPNTLIYLTPNTFIKNGSSITPLVPSVSGGAVASYTISPTLPQGLLLNTTTGQISGTPEVVSSKTTYTITATNSGGSTNANIELEIIDIPPQNLLYPSPNNLVITGDPIEELKPSNAGGAITQYNITPSLPQGLLLNTSTGIISGIPVVESVRTTYTVTGANAAGSVTSSFTIGIQKDLPPILFNYLAALPLTFTVGTAISELVPKILGGSVRFSVSPRLPDGLVLDSITGKIYGTPTVAVPLTNYIITARGSGGNLSFTLPITVLDISPASLSYPPVSSFIRGTPINNLVPNVSGGVVTKYTISPALPEGLMLDTLTGVISGKPLMPFNTPVQYTISASNSEGETSTLISFFVKDIPPSALSYITPSILTKGLQMRDLSPEVSGGFVSSYRISPSLPLGLKFDTFTGVISGVPQELKPLSNYIVTAINSEGSDSAVLQIQINDIAPLNFNYTPASCFVAFGIPISSLVPSSVGGAIVSYSIVPELPDGLVIDPVTGIISGALNIVLNGSQTYTITATNSGGSTTATVTLIYNSAPTDIDLTPKSIAENSSIGTTVGSLSVTDPDQGDTHSYSLVSGTGDTDNASFTITGNTLKTAEVFDFETKSSYSIRVKVTDAGGLSYEKVFTITVNDVDEDRDGDGVMDSQELIDGTNPLNECSLKLESQTVTPSVQWLNGDCNGDGIKNGQQLVITKYATKPQLLADGTMNIKFVTNIRNLRPESVDLSRVQNNLANAFVGQTSFRVTGIKASGTLVAANSFDGRTQTNLIGSGSRIRGYNKDSIVVDVNVSPNGFAGIVSTTTIAEGTGTFSLPFATSSTDTTLSANGQIVSGGLPTKVEIPKVDYFIPDAFSPNRDGVNDYFVVIRPFQAVVSIEIFNRWGNVIYKNNNYNNDWDGRSMPQYGNGDVPEGTYFYIIQAKEINGKVSQFKGYITLKR